jgi:acyl-CoA thioesterase YciA
LTVVVSSRGGINLFTGAGLSRPRFRKNDKHETANRQEDVPMAADERYLALKVVMMPRDMNRYGTIFGGITLSYLDQAGAVGAHHEIRRAGWPEQPIVLVAMNKVEFHQPVFVGDVVSFWTRLIRVGRTSLTMHVTVEADHEGEVAQLTEAESTYVAVDLSSENRRPVPIRGS